MEFLAVVLALYGFAVSVVAILLFFSRKSLIKKYQVNPGYETQLMFADLMRGHALFHIERVEPQNVFLRRHDG
jgi:hypothetical protein